MKNLRLFIIVFFCFSKFNLKAQSTEKIKLVQICLDDMHKDSLLEPPVVLLENKYSGGLQNLHLGKNKITLKKISSNDWVSSLRQIKDDGFRYFYILSYVKHNNRADICIRLISSVVKYTLTQKHSIWFISGSDFTLDEVPIADVEEK
jgi:hypothetical protein